MSVNCLVDELSCSPLSMQEQQRETSKSLHLEVLPSTPVDVRIFKRSHKDMAKKKKKYSLHAFLSRANALIFQIKIMKTDKSNISVHVGSARPSCLGTGQVAALTTPVRWHRCYSALDFCSACSE